MEEFINYLGKNNEAISAIRDLSLMFVGLIGVVLLSVRTVALKKSSNAAEAQALEAIKRTRLTEEEQLNSQYISAIEQLSSKDKTIRIGGIFSLAQISETSVRLRKIILEVLETFVSDKASIDLPKQNRRQSDIQAALDILGRLERDRKLDLSNCNLSGYTFRGDFSKTTFMGSTMESCSFFYCDISSADFYEATFDRSIFTECMCKDTEFSLASLKYAIFNGCTHLSTANFHGSDCSNADFSEVELLFHNEHRFKNADITGCRFYEMKC